MAVILTIRRSYGGTSTNANVLITNEAAIGTKNNLNKIFTTVYNYLTGSLSVYYNGQILIKNDDYEEQGPNEFRLIYIKPYSDDSLVVDYQIPT